MRHAIVRVVDVNILVNAHRTESPHHLQCKRWLELAGREPEGIGLSDLALAAFVRITTNPTVFHPPTPIAAALQQSETLRGHPGCILVSPGPRHWSIFSDLCRKADLKGPAVTDAWFAALAIELDAEWMTLDRDFARFPGLRWSTPD